MVEKEGNIKKEISSERKIELANNKFALKAAISAMLSALGVLLGGLNIFAFTGDVMKVFPFAHTINAIAGVWLGPVYAVVVATIIAIIRFATGLGTINAFPGGIPGAIVVGIVAYLLKKSKNNKYQEIAAFFEPIGTVFIGASLSYYVFMNQYATLMFWWGSFAMSCIPGCIIGFIVIIMLKKYKNIDYNTFN